VFVVLIVIVVLGGEYQYNDLLRAVITYSMPISRRERHQKEFDMTRAKLMDLNTEGGPPRRETTVHVLVREEIAPHVLSFYD